MLDGVFSRAVDGAVYEAAQLTPERWHELQYVVQRRVLRYFHRHGLLDEADAHGMLSWQGSGGLSIDASVRIEGEERAGVERLLPLLRSSSVRAGAALRPRTCRSGRRTQVCRACTVTDGH